MSYNGINLFVEHTHHIVATRNDRVIVLWVGYVNILLAAIYNIMSYYVDYMNGSLAMGSPYNTCIEKRAHNTLKKTSPSYRANVSSIGTISSQLCVHLSRRYPRSTTHRSNVGPMLAHRLRRWPNIVPTLDRCVVFAGYPVRGKQNVRDST